MHDHRFPLSVMLFLVALLGYLTYQIMRPFLIPLAWAIVFSILFYPLYIFTARRIRVRAFAALLTLLLIVIVILGPIASLAVILNREITLLGTAMSRNNYEEINALLRHPNLTHFLEHLRSFLGDSNFLSPEIFAGHVRVLAEKLVDYISPKMSDVFSVLLDFVLMLFAAFFLLKDGSLFLQKMQGYLPFRPVYNERLASQVKDMVVSTVYGGVAVSIVQGVLGGLVFWGIGLASPMLWGFVMSLMSFVPLIGTFAVWGPAAAILFFQGAHLKALMLFLFGVFVISMADNILRPLIIGTRTKMHTMAIFFSVLGGLRLFGIIGFILGPLIMALFVSMLEIFRHPDSEILADEDVTPS